MITFTINGIEVQAEKNSSILDTAKFYGIDVPTLCYHEGLSPSGICRLCIVEVTERGKTRIEASCVSPVREGIEVMTHTKRVVEDRKLLVELLLARCPSSKVLQDLAAKLGVERVRFNLRYEDCILCGLCVQMCREQMMAGAIDFVNRSTERTVSTPFSMKSEVCRSCGACMYICPACQLRCDGSEAHDAVCGGCQNIEYPCLALSNEVMCYLDPCAGCFLEKEKEV
ncbi:MAG: 2Fe-2S iron-sulfur cluster-binding protein [Actinomycetota bacterium]|nr:2Fe-2S iron-sulfur cluster-binding protein [Actinomycetota bacterium]